jgi:hypothetical protein
MAWASDAVAGVPKDAYALARDLRFLELPAGTGRFKTLSLSCSRKKGTAQEVSVVRDEKYRGGLGLRIQAESAEQAGRRASISLYFYPSGSVRGKKLRMTMTIHTLTGRALFIWKPRQWKLKEAFLDSRTLRRVLEPGVAEIEHLVPVHPRADYMDAQFWIVASEPFVADIEGITIALDEEPAIRILPETTLLPSGTTVLRGHVRFDAARLGVAAKARVRIELRDAHDKPLAASTLALDAFTGREEAPKSSRRRFALGLPPDIAPGACEIVAFMEGAEGGAKQARAAHKLTVIPGY